ncbi:MAG TPA: hypothetical protein VLC74_14095 [Rhizomicrobium sp.]|nr:hypothetical protein [Rhizomicrobium sp.]
MAETDLLNLGRSITANEVSWLGQVITINFAMVVGIYYFLNRAGLALKIFAFVAYLLGMLLYLGEMLIESGLKRQVFDSLQAMHNLSPIARTYLGVNQSWLGNLTSVFFNGAFWILTIGTFYLLFFWRKSADNPHADMP